MDIQEKPIIQFICNDKTKIYFPITVKNGLHCANVYALFDTGTEITVITKNLFDSLELKREERGKLKSASGSINVISSNIEISFRNDDNLIVSEFQEISCCAPFIDDNDITAHDFCDVIIGMNFIKKYRWILTPNNNDSFTVSVYDFP